MGAVSLRRENVCTRVVVVLQSVLGVCVVLVVWVDLVAFCSGRCGHNLFDRFISWMFDSWRRLVFILHYGTECIAVRSTILDHPKNCFIEERLPSMTLRVQTHRIIEGIICPR